MRIRSLNVKNYMLFDTLDIKWSPNINIISGANSTGKTTLIKCLYSLYKSAAEAARKDSTADRTESVFVQKILGVFRPDDMRIGRLVSRRQGNNAGATLFSETDDGASISVSFSNRQDKHATVKVNGFQAEMSEAIYIPPKEMISATEHFQSLYEDYHIDFEEMYYDLTKLLARPLKKGPNSAQQNYVLNSFEKIMNGQIVQRDKKFFLRLKGKGEFEMGLLSEGYRKLATIIYLIQSGSLNEHSILFWDEPETNMNPAMVSPVVEAILKLAETGVQVFITTHDYFVQQAFNLYNAYPVINTENIDIKFISLYSDNGSISWETSTVVSELKHNSIMQEFDNIYDKEQAIIYDSL